MKKQENPIYSRIDYENAYYAKKDVLSAQLDLLNTAKTMENYKELRKQELMLKLKLKNDLKKIKENISKLIERSPKTPEINEAMKENKQKSKAKTKKHKTLSNVESELIKVQEKLKEMD